MPECAASLFSDPSRALVLACSARAGGNTDTAASLAAAALAEAGGWPCDVRRVADLPLQPCISCGYCDTHPGACLLDPATGGARAPDCALPLLLALCRAPAACLVSPMYFYHLPGRAKGLIDRAQSFWAVPEEAKPGRGRSLGVVLLGARERGDKLFAGALLTLKYAAKTLGLTLAEPLLLYGLDSPDALARRPELQARIAEYGRDFAVSAASAAPGHPA